MFGKKPSRQSELELDVAAHKEGIENPPLDLVLPDHKQPVSIDTMSFGRIGEADRQFFGRTERLGSWFGRLFDNLPWRAIETDKALAERWAGHIGKGIVGRHFDLYFHQLRAGALAIGADVDLRDVLGDVRLSLTIKYPFLYRYDDIYDMLRLLIVQISEGTREDVLWREQEVTGALLRTLWNVRHDEAYHFAFTQAGPATKMFSILERER
ncbi:hypothetical protein AMC78_CH02618 [Rhizobium phaseoli]|uniref:hypothetical protein n=1 Tax=Rhizobium phaseoli TaxID=396 RepID=UPI0007EBB7B2|nr:hypothetical protein [Rhizobium phaseoli]ANM04704.1 hypothetical protein AMC78_CH02618 [Rhizobium phaseoli]